jgi:hypothetical protein
MPSSSTVDQARECSTLVLSHSKSKPHEIGSYGIADGGTEGAYSAEK